MYIYHLTNNGYQKRTIHCHELALRAFIMEALNAQCHLVISSMLKNVLYPSSRQENLNMNFIQTPFTTVDECQHSSSHHLSTSRIFSRLLKDQNSTRTFRELPFTTVQTHQKLSSHPFRTRIHLLLSRIHLSLSKSGNHGRRV